MRSILFAGLLGSLAAPAFGAVLEKLPGGVPSTWSLVDMPSADTTVQLSIALTRKNLDRLDYKLSKLSTPGNAQYGQWMNKDDIDSYFPITNDAAVVAWLQGADISDITRNGALLSFAGNVGTINKLLDTEFAYYKKGSAVKLRTTQYSIPDELSQYIELISPTVYFGQPHGSNSVPSQPHKHVTRSAATNTTLARCEESITAACLQRMYNVGNYSVNLSAGSRIGFASFDNESASYSDLAKYEAINNIPSQNFTTQLINGGVNNQSFNLDGNDEANLDVQMVIAVSNPLPVVQYIIGGSAVALPDADEPENEPFLAFYEHLLNQDDSEIPQVLSISYGDDEQTVPEKYAKRVCNAIGLNTLRGISILHSSGDTGVGSACQASDLTTPQFNPVFPATCPYVTAVGGTDGVAHETAWNASSGGFSNYFDRAWYQNTSVQSYLDHYISPQTRQYYSHYANFSGRGFPDVAAHSAYPLIEIFSGGGPVKTGGTSAATPIFGGIIALLNDARLRAGKPVLGFLNPFIYSSGYKALRDITAGGSYGCGGIDPQTQQPVNGSLVIPYAHWNATRGWDPVTGLGTPDFQKLKALVMAM
ncbi:hypothetical protein N7540_000195 [Penicillium herquei]|nr:hypothetical protein N7540_000195 [Penicillium herquei]